MPWRIWALTAPSYAWESSVTLSYTAYGSNGTVTGSVTLKVSNSASGGIDCQGTGSRRAAEAGSG